MCDGLKDNYCEILFMCTKDDKKCIDNHQTYSESCSRLTVYDRCNSVITNVNKAVLFLKNSGLSKEAIHSIVDDVV